MLLYSHFSHCFADSLILDKLHEIDQMLQKLAEISASADICTNQLKTAIENHSSLEDRIKLIDSLHEILQQVDEINQGWALYHLANSYALCPDLVQITRVLRDPSYVEHAIANLPKQPDHLKYALCCLNSIREGQSDYIVKLCDLINYTSTVDGLGFVDLPVMTDEMVEKYDSLSIVSGKRIAIFLEKLTENPDNPDEANSNYQLLISLLYVTSSQVSAHEHEDNFIICYSSAYSIKLLANLLIEFTPYWKKLHDFICRARKHSLFVNNVKLIKLFLVCLHPCLSDKIALMKRFCQEDRITHEDFQQLIKILIKLNDDESWLNLALIAFCYYKHTDLALIHLDKIAADASCQSNAEALRAAIYLTKSEHAAKDELNVVGYHSHEMRDAFKEWFRTYSSIHHYAIVETLNPHLIAYLQLGRCHSVLFKISPPFKKSWGKAFAIASIKDREAVDEETATSFTNKFSESLANH